MIRSSKHTLKFSNKQKLNIIDTFYEDYSAMLQIYVDQIVNQQLPLKTFLSSKDLPIVTSITHSQWKQIAYKQAVEIVKGNLNKTKKIVFKRLKYLYAKCAKEEIHTKFTSKKFRDLNINFLKRVSRIKLKNVSIPIDNRLVDFQEGDNSFDNFVRIKTPYFPNGKKRAITINIPIKDHRVSRKFITNQWSRKNIVMLRKKKGMFFLDLFWKKEDIKKKEIKKRVGIDQGFRKLISSSSGKHYGINLRFIYDKISRKEQGSNAFKRSLKERNDLINFHVKEFISKEQPDELIIEHLKNVKSNSKGKIYKKTMNKLQHWSYNQAVSKLTSLSETEGFSIKKVNPAYTSQRCSECGCIEKKNRKGEQYQCVNCGYVNDADVNAALNILHIGEYGPYATENKFL